MKLLVSLSENEDCSFEDLGKIFDPIGLNVTDITDDYICFYIEDQTESVNIKYLLEQLLFAAKKFNKGA